MWFGSMGATDMYNGHPDKTVVCTVTSAEGKNLSGRAIGTWSRVLIETTDCGRLSLSIGVTPENRDTIAGELATDRRYAFTISGGTGSWWNIDKLFGIASSVLAYEEAHGTS